MKSNAIGRGTRIVHDRAVSRFMGSGPALTVLSSVLAISRAVVSNRSRHVSAMAAVFGSLVSGSATVATAWITQKALSKRELIG